MLYPVYLVVVIFWNEWANKLLQYISGIERLFDDKPFISFIWVAQKMYNKIIWII